jgi:1,4-alpha-glucan branching enzyme
MMGEFGKDWFKWWPGTDYGKQFTIEFFHEVNKHWLKEYRVDGFRYDFVPGMYDGPKGPGYADLAYRTYQDSLKIPRFQPPGLRGGPARSTLIQCAEHVEDPRKILGTTYSNCCWQDELMHKARDMAKWNYVNQAFAHLLDPELNHYPAEYKNPESGETFPVAPFQYLESHDHRRFVNHFGELDVRDVLGERYGDRNRFYYKEQPYIIALYTGKGIPMLWQGQEFGENWGLPEVFGGKGLGRNLFERPLHWEYFYDRPGRALIRLHRDLGTLRRDKRAFNARGFFYYYDRQDHLDQRVVAYRREAEADLAQGRSAERFVVALNFSDQVADVWMPFPFDGEWKELIGDKSPVHVAPGTGGADVRIPSNYGAVYELA